MLPVVLLGVALLDKDILIQSIPDSRPILVSPAEAEGEIRLSRSQHLIERTTQKAPAVEPVAVVAKAMDAILPCQVRLGLAGFR